MKKILVVEDESIIAMELELHLKEMGYEVVGRASSGVEAIAKARELRPDLILMDIVMPGEKNGIDAAEEIKSEMGVPVIFVTAYADEEFIKKAKTVEPFGYIVKPYEDRELRAGIEIALYKKEMERQLQTAHDNLSTANEQLRQEIEERTRAEEALRVAYKELEALDKMKTAFLSVAYHEMLTPLAPIVGYTNLLEQGELSDKQKKYVSIIEKSASQLKKLIGSLLEVTRIEGRKLELTLEPVSIPEIVNNALERIQPQVDAKKQTISTVVPEGLEVEGDKQKIASIFDNLISNAIKYTDEKGRIDIVAEDRKEEKDIRVCVADTGAGIPEEHLPMVFERFYMVDTSLTRKSGLGLGLAIVKGYVELHGGEVWATSEPGKGSKFCFTLPKRQRQRQRQRQR
jgi:signal transduction histidine kinase